MAPLRVFVTGGSGFVGSAILSSLKSQHPDWELFSFDFKPSRANENDVTYIAGDVTSEESLRAALTTAQPNAVIHTAGMVPSNADRYDHSLRPALLKLNVEGTRILLKVTRIMPSVRAFIYTSSVTVTIDDRRYQYCNFTEEWPTCSDAKYTTPYGESKALAEGLVLAADDPHSGFRTLAIRPPAIMGPGDTVFIPTLLEVARSGQMPFILGEGTNMWDTIYVDDVADAHVAAVENLLSKNGFGDRKRPDAGGQAFLISTGDPVPCRDLCKAVWREFGLYPTIEVHISESIVLLLAFVVEWAAWILHLRPFIHSGLAWDGCASRYANIRKAEEVLGWRPKVGLEETIRRSCKAYLKQSNLHREI